MNSGIGLNLPLGATLDSNAAELQTGQILAEESAREASLTPQETIASRVPCKTETNSEVTKEADETIVHQPGAIYVNQPPTRLIINHAPFLLRPSPVVLQQGGKTITHQITRNFLPSPVQVRPVIVRIVKPIEKKVLVEKPNFPGPGQTIVVPPPQVDSCAEALNQAALSQGALSQGALSQGILGQGIYNQGIYNQGILNSGISALSQPAISPVYGGAAGLIQSPYLGGQFGASPILGNACNAGEIEVQNDSGNYFTGDAISASSCC